MRPTPTIAILGFLAGCSQMTVRVDIFNQEYANGTAFLAAAVRGEERKASMLVDGGELDRREAALTGEVRSRIRDLVEQSIAPIGSDQPATRSSGPTLFSDVQAVMHKGFTEARQDYQNFLMYAAKAQSASAVPPSPQSDQVRKNLQLALQSYADAEQVLRRTRTDLINRFLDQVAPLASGDATVAMRVAQATRTLTKHADEQIGSLIGSTRNSVYEDPNASLLVNAPPQAWTGVFNRTYGLGTFGNTDIAVKMEGVANFTNKGVRVDATKVTQTAFNGINLLTKLMAAYEGVPLGVTSGGGNAGAAPVSPPTASDQQKLDAQQKVRQQQAAAADILRSIVREAVAVDAPGDTDAEKSARKSAVQRVKSAFTANQSELAPSVAGGNQ